MNYDVYDWINSTPSSFVFSPRDILACPEFSYQETRVLAELENLNKNGEIRLICKDLYDRPGRNYYSQDKILGLLWPSMDSVLAANIRHTPYIIKPGYNFCLNYFGISNQVPAQAIFYTTGPNEILKICNLKLHLTHEEGELMLYPNSNIGNVITVLKIIGPSMSHEVASKLCKYLRQPEMDILNSLEGLSYSLSRNIAFLTTQWDSEF